MTFKLIPRCNVSAVLIWRTDVALLAEMHDAGSSVWSVLFAYGMLALNNMFHAAAFFMILGRLHDDLLSLVIVAWLRL